MLLELIVASAMVIATVLIHGLGLALLGRMLQEQMRAERLINLSPLSLGALKITIVLVLGLFVLHGAEVWLYAFLYHWLGAVSDLRQAVYFSAITYGAIGFSDAGLNDDWRLLAAIEGLNGVILLGWSTAFFVTMISRVGRRR